MYTFLSNGIRNPGHSSDSRIWHSLVMSLSRTEVFVLSFTDRTRPLASGFVSSTLPNGQDPRGAVGSTTRTTSPTLRFLFSEVHFCLSCSSRRYSLVHLCQKRSAMYWTCFQRRLAVTFSGKDKIRSEERRVETECRP